MKLNERYAQGKSFRAGARFGPAAIGDASVLLRPYNPGAGVDVFGTLSVTNGGDIAVVPGYIEDSYALIEAGLKPIVDVGMRGSIYAADDYDAARNLGFTLMLNDEMRQHTMSKVAEIVRKRVGDGPSFLTFDVDFVDPAFTPDTGTTEVGGITSWEASILSLLTLLKCSLLMTQHRLRLCWPLILLTRC